MKQTTRYHCAPTAFLIACCFNRRYPLSTRKRPGNLRSRMTVKRGALKTCLLSGNRRNDRISITGKSFAVGDARSMKETKDKFHLNSSQLRETRRNDHGKDLNGSSSNAEKDDGVSLAQSGVTLEDKNVTCAKEVGADVKISGPKFVNTSEYLVEPPFAYGNQNNAWKKDCVAPDGRKADSSTVLKEAVSLKNGLIYDSLRLETKRLGGISRVDSKEEIVQDKIQRKTDKIELISHEKQEERFVSTDKPSALEENNVKTTEFTQKTKEPSEFTRESGVEDKITMYVSQMTSKSQNTLHFPGENKDTQGMIPAKCQEITNASTNDNKDRNQCYLGCSCNRPDETKNGNKQTALEHRSNDCHMDKCQKKISEPANTWLRIRAVTK